MTYPPSPLEWHPWYRDKPWLIDWLNSGAPDICLPVFKPLTAIYGAFDATAPFEVAEIEEHLYLQKRWAAGPAPYVGDVFFYRWYVATDQYGRSIAGESARYYPEPTYTRGRPDCL